MKKIEQEIIEKSQAFVQRIKEVCAHPHYMAVWISYNNHGGDYTDGPKWSAEFEALEAALEKLK